MLTNRGHTHTLCPRFALFCLGESMEADLLARREQELVGRARTKDSAAFAELYDLHYRRVYTYIYYRVSSQELAEDLAADVFVRGWQAIGSFDYRGVPLAAWLLRIARNRVIDHFRRAGKRETVELEDHHVDSLADPVSEVENHLLQEDLVRHMRHLTGDQRDVIILKFFEGMSNTEVSSVMGKPEGAVKSLQHRGLAALRRRWGRGGEE
jgi:RNA polymerase sigma-70 factor (ECF subfamily)